MRAVTGMRGPCKFRGTMAFLAALLCAASILLLGVGAAQAAKVADPASPDIAARVMPAPPMVVGTYDDQGRTNFALFDRGGIATSKPDAIIAICMDRSRYTYRNAVARRSLTVNIPSEAYAAETDLFGSFSGISGDVYTDKLAATGLHADQGRLADAPMIREFPVSIECELLDVENIDPDSPYDLLLLKVVNVWLDERYLNDRGALNPKPAAAPGIMFYNPGRGDHYGYYGLGRYLGRPETLGTAYVDKISAGGEGGSSSGSGCDALLGGGLALFSCILLPCLRRR